MLTNNSFEEMAMAIRSIQSELVDRLFSVVSEVDAYQLFRDIEQYCRGFGNPEMAHRWLKARITMRGGLASMIGGNFREMVEWKWANDTTDAVPCPPISYGKQFNDFAKMTHEEKQMIMIQETNLGSCRGESSTSKSSDTSPPKYPEYDEKIKNYTKELAEPIKIIKCGFLLPGKDLLDFKMFHDKGKIDLGTTRLSLIEKENCIRNAWDNGTTHACDLLHRMNDYWYNRRLHELPDNKYGYGWFDSTGYFSEADAFFLANAIEFANKSQLHITIPANTRGNRGFPKHDLMVKTDERFKRLYRRLYCKLRSKAREFDYLGGSGRITDDRVMTYSVILRVLLCRWDFEFFRPVVYRRRAGKGTCQTMMFFSFLIHGKKQNLCNQEESLLNTLLKQFNTEVEIPSREERDKEANKLQKECAQEYYGRDHSQIKAIRTWKGVGTSL